MLNFQWHSFSELTGEQVYSMLKLRSSVFVVEQQCPYQDVDGQDKNALHLFGIENNSLVAYLRLFPPADAQNYIVFGRVVTATSARNKGYGKNLLQELFAYCDGHFPGIRIECSAQHYLLKFYESFGLKAYGEVYEEDGIPHIGMKT